MKTQNTKEMKARLNAESNVLQVVEVVTYGVQAYNVTENEYEVIVKACRKANGRYYFITREGRRIAWAWMDAEQVERICGEILEQQPTEEIEPVSECVTEYRHTTAERVSQVCKTIAEAVSVCCGSSLPVSDMAIDLQRFASWCLYAEAPASVQNFAPFWFAVRKQGSESGSREYCKERCAHLGAPVYIIKVEREPIAGLYTMKVKACRPSESEKVCDAYEAAKESAESAEDSESTNDTNDTNDTEKAAQSEKKGILYNLRDLYEGSAPDIKKRAAKALARVNAVCRSCSLWSLRVFVLAAYFVLCFASMAITGNAVASVVGRSIPVVFLVTLPCMCIVTFSLAYGYIKALNWFNNRVGIFDYFKA